MSGPDSERELVSTYYRSLTPDGKVWCESRNPHEVLDMSEGKTCTYQIIHVYKVTDGWQDWEQE